MKQFAVRPRIVCFDTCRDFAEAFRLGPRDLIITNEYIYEPYLKGLDNNSRVIFQERFGAGEPSDEMAEAISRDIADLEYDRVIAVGGGTIIDIAKLYALEKYSPVLDLFDKKIPAVKSRKLIIVPTTCGTGSEVTNLSILALISRNTKLGLADDALFADDAVLIPELLKTLPFKVFAASSIDALIHAVESSLSPKANAFTMLYSYAAMDMIINGYAAIERDGPDARLPLLADFHTAATYAGIAFGNAGCGAVHAMSYPLGAAYHVPHGESNYALFVGILKKYKELDPNGRITTLEAHLAPLLSCERAELYDRLESLLSSVLMRKPISQYGVTAKDIEDFTETVMTKQGRLMANCCTPLSAEDVKDIYTKLY